MGPGDGGRHGGGDPSNGRGGRSGDAAPPTTGGLVLRQMACGSLARAVTATLLIPLDTVKTRLQFQGVMDGAVVRRYDGFVDAFQAIVREEGVRALYKGAATRRTVGVDRVAPALTLARVRRALAAPGLPPRLLYIGPAAGIR